MPVAAIESVALPESEIRIPWLPPVTLATTRTVRPAFTTSIPAPPLPLGAEARSPVAVRSKAPVPSLTARTPCARPLAPTMRALMVPLLAFVTTRPAASAEAPVAAMAPVATTDISSPPEWRTHAPLVPPVTLATLTVPRPPEFVT